jgi:hypothetical protein
MASNPFIGNGFVNGALGALGGYQQQKTDNENRALKKAQIDATIAYRKQQEDDRQQSIKDRADNYKSQEANRRMSMYLRRQDSGEFDGKSDAEIKAILGFDPNDPMGDGPMGSGAPSAMSSTPPPSVAQPNAMGQPPGALGSPGNPVDAIPPTPPFMPTNQGYPNVLAGPAGPGLPQGIPPPPQRGMPQGLPPSALQALKAQGIGPGLPLPQRPPSQFQMPNPTANGQPPQGQPFAFPPAQGNLTPSDMQSGGATPWQTPQGMAQPAGIPPQLRPLTPRGPALTGVHPLSFPGGYDPVAAAQSRMQQDQDRLQQIAGIVQGGLIRSQKGRAAFADEQKSLMADLDKQNDNINNERRNQRQGEADFTRNYVQGAAAKLDPRILTDMANSARDSGLNVVAPRQHVIDRGLSEDAWKRVDNAAQDALDADPEHWQEKTYNGKPFSYYYDTNGNRLSVPEDVKSEYATAGLTKSAQDVAASKVRTAYTDAMRRYVENTRTPQAQAQTAYIKANMKYLEGPKTAETQAITKSILEGRIPIAIQQIEALKQKNAGIYKADGNIAGTSAKDINRMMAQQRSNVLAMNKIRYDQANMIMRDPASLTGADAQEYWQLHEQDADLNKQIAAAKAAQKAAGSGGGGTGNIEVSVATPGGNRIALMAANDQAQVCKDPNDRQCQKHLRTSLQKAIPGAYDDVWDRSPTATAMSNLNRFIARKIAKPYTPGMAIPPGSILYSTKLGKANGGNSGHGSLVGTQGERYDQHGVNHFPASDYDWYVPPPGGAQRTVSAPPAAGGWKASPSGAKYRAVTQ